MHTKKEFRRRQRQILLQFAKTEQKQKEDKILFKKLINSSMIRDKQKIGVTASLPMEIDTSRIITALWGMDKQVYLPKAYPDKDHHQDFLRYTPHTKLIRSKFGVLEVADVTAEVNNNLDLLIVPGLAFAQNEHARLGFGGGYYDRFLARYETIETVSLANSKMLFKEAKWPVETTDVPIDIIINSSDD